MQNIVEWAKEYPGSITVCDPQGIVLFMNDKSASTFAKDGGYALVGQNLLDCHPEPSRTRLLELMEKRETNVYTIEKNGLRKLIYQSPWYEAGEYRGFVELALVLPAEMPHFVRK